MRLGSNLSVKSRQTSYLLGGSVKGLQRRIARRAFSAALRKMESWNMRSCFLEVGGASLTAEQLICRETTELARLDVRLACMTGGGRPSRIPELLREALTAYRSDANTDIETTEKWD